MYLSCDVAVLVQGLQSIVKDLPPLLQEGYQLLLQLVTHLQVLGVVDGLKELHRWLVSRSTCEDRSHTDHMQVM